ncbi:hypothetical protein BDF19DRAFT_450666 [Syncephalis fuscata]|nr:hypothetical protein BDF19DRAFT_450666 [Syncephalis fuscata]
MAPSEPFYYWGNIKIFRSGELNGFDFLTEELNDLSETRVRFYSIGIQLLINHIILIVFVRNFYHGVKMVVGSALGCGFQITAINYALPSEVNCRTTVWGYSVVIVIVNIFVDFIILHKAWLAHGRNTWLFVVGILLMLPLPGTVYVVWMYGVIKADRAVGCLFIYPYYYPLLKVATELPINLAFSAAFLVVIRRQYKQMGSRVWKYLLKEGFIYVFGVVISNVTCLLIATTKPNPNIGEVVFIIDWAIISTLLIEQQKGISKAFKQDVRPKTDMSPLNITMIEYK